MNFEITTKIIFGSVSAFGTIAIVFYNFGQTRKIRAELLEKFEESISKSNKHSATELFRLLHGLRMSYTDIVELITRDNCSKIIYALKKTPGIVCYENGEFRYTNVGRNKIYQFVDRWIMKTGIVLFSVVAVISFGFFTFGKGSISIVSFVILIFSVTMFALQLRQKNYDRMVSNLINPEHNQANAADAKDRTAD